MRIAQVCPYSLRVPGGVQAQVVALAKALSSLGHDAEVVAPVGRSLRVPANGSLAPIAPFPITLYRTSKEIRLGDFDVVHLHEPLVPGPALACLARCRRPMMATFHRSGDSWAYKALGPPARRLASRLELRCAVSEAAAETAARALGGEYELVFNGVDIDLFAGADPRPTSAPTIAFIGRHEERKGLSVLLDAYRLLPTGTRLWVMGEGPRSRRMRSKTAELENVEWLGRVEDGEKASRIKGADVLCAPSLFGESFGVVLLEAMSAGTPVVASDLPGYRAAAGRDTSLLVRPGDPVSLAGALRQVLEEPGLGRKMAVRGRERAAEFSMERLAGRYLAMYAAMSPVAA